jgi:hypothetical protein
MTKCLDKMAFDTGVDDLYLNRLRRLCLSWPIG